MADLHLRTPGPEHFLQFVREREDIRLRRESGVLRPDWTSDPIFRRYKFTNVRRRHDRVSRVIIRDFIEPNSCNLDLWFDVLMCRLINWPPTLWALDNQGVFGRAASDFDPEEFSYIIETYRQDNVKSYTGAYMVYPTRKAPGTPKSQLLAENILLPASKLFREMHQAVASNRVENAVDVLSGSFGVSDFMAGQVAADLTYAEEQLGWAEDLYTYAPLGPGSQKGLNYVLSVTPVTKAWASDDFCAELIRFRKSLAHRWWEFEDLTLHDVQNCFCEYSKYCLAMAGGKPKNTYEPEVEF